MTTPIKVTPSQAKRLERNLQGTAKPKKAATSQTKITYKYLMSRSKSDLATWVLTQLDFIEELQSRRDVKGE